MIPTTLTRQTLDTIDRILRASLAPWHYGGFDAEARLDSTGDPAIFITARFDPVGEMPPSSATSRIMLELFDALREDGDPRIPYLYYRYPEEAENDEAA